MGALLEVQNLTIGFPENGHFHTVVDDISFTAEQGQILGIVGESGSGKSMTALAAMGLLRRDAKITGGKILFDGTDMVSLSQEERSKWQGSEMSMIFQEPMTSLNPVMRIGQQVGESLRLHTDLSKEEIRHRVIQALEGVQLPDAEKIYHQYPHELSGGMRQRVMIAQAMICSPKLLIADEPTTALDVVVQAQILQLLRQLHESQQVSILFISHDLNIIKEICSDVLVMYQGRIVERGPVRQVLEHPQHAYTKTLVARLPNHTAQADYQQKILELQNLSVYYQEKGKGFFSRSVHHRVVKDVSLDVYEGELMGIVGESGCGKSTLAKAIVGLNRDYAGKLLAAEGAHPQMVFQDPFGSLNPAHRVGWLLEEPLRVSGVKDPQKRREQVIRMLEDIGLDESFYSRYPRELSGGQRQRISIGMALLMKSRLLVADEPVSALDVTVQSQILDLLLQMHQNRNLTILLISHDLEMVRHICNRVAVIYKGEIVEMAPVEAIYQHPMHPYTRLLFASAVAGTGRKSGEAPLTVDMADPAGDSVGAWEEDATESQGCAFYHRCPYAKEECRVQKPGLSQISGEGPKGHYVKCWNTEIG